MGLAILLTLIAGSSTVIGGLIGTHPSICKCKTLAIALSFSAGAMIYVSFSDLLPESISVLNNYYSVSTSLLLVVLSFALGALVIKAIDHLLPQPTKKCTVLEEGIYSNESKRKSKKLLRSGVLMATILAIHNFPEGVATFSSTMHAPILGVTLAIAIALHNIPEGIAVAAPIYHASGSRKKAITYSAFSGVTEPICGLLGYLFLAYFLPSGALGLLFSATAGMMVYVSFSELLPAARYYQTHLRQSFAGFFAGVTIMFLSLTMLKF